MGMRGKRNRVPIFFCIFASAKTTGYEITPYYNSTRYPTRRL